MTRSGLNLLNSILKNLDNNEILPNNDFGGNIKMEIILLY